MKANTTNYYTYNSKLHPLANTLRKEITKSEACLGKHALRAGQMKGYQFRRQRSVLQYIADFVCKELKLVIEVDGLTHQWGETAVKDNQKANTLELAGFKVVRFTDEEVLKNMNAVRGAIQCVVEEREKATPFTPASGGQLPPSLKLAEGPRINKVT